MIINIEDRTYTGPYKMFLELVEIAKEAKAGTYAIVAIEKDGVAVMLRDEYDSWYTLHEQIEIYEKDRYVVHYTRRP